LVALGLRLRLTRDLVTSDTSAAVEAIEDARSEVHSVHEELRALAHGVYPPVLTQHGLVEALGAAADRCPLPVELDVMPVGRYPAEIEATVYFCCAEALQNSAKHAGADARVYVRLGADDDHLSFAVSDDGRGFDPATVQPGGGLDNLRDRVGSHGGSLEVRARRGGGAAIEGRVPIGPAPA
jgi:signal transduction histidine kinase